jgi:multisubunit Na+/H+ antiporter MnhC subunit
MDPSDLRLLGLVLYAGAVALAVIGIYLVVAGEHVIRILLGLTLLESGVNLVLVAAGFRPAAVAPIHVDGLSSTASMVDPVPQALILTTIVIGVGILALALALAVQIHRRYGTLDMRALQRILNSDQASASPDAVPAAPPAGLATARVTGDGR